MTSSKLAGLLLAFTLIAAAALRIYGAAAKDTFSEDENFSLLYATGHASEYYDMLEEKPPFGVWVPAAEWKKFTQPDRLFCFSKITRDMAFFDIHPPFYFWFLHVWTFIAGVNLWTGLTLNLLISSVAILSLYGLGRYVLGSSVEAALAACVWALSPAVFQMAFEARQYDMLILVTILFVWQFLRYVDVTRAPRLFDFILMAAVTTAGALTHFHFSILVGGCGLYALARLWREQKNHLAAVSGAVLLGDFIFFWITPNFYRSFANAGETLNVFSYEALMIRVANIVNSCRQFFQNPLPFVSTRHTLPILLVAGGVLAYRKRPAMLLKHVRDTNWNGVHILYFGLWMIGVLIALYLAFLTPVQSMLPKHLGMAWPFFAFLPVFVLRLFPKYKNHLAALGCVLALLPGINGAKAFREYLIAQPNPSAILAQAPAVVMDNVSIGYVPRVLWKLSDGTPVFVASRSYLLQHQAQWLNRLDSGAVYISIHSAEHFAGNLKGGQQQLYELINRNWENDFMKDAVWGFGDAMRLRKKIF
jgi:4-amino-4-deoxy-L-arabinose transferase-like glycosyltransferase